MLCRKCELCLLGLNSSLCDLDDCLEDLSEEAGDAVRIGVDEETCENVEELREESFMFRAGGEFISIRLPLLDKLTGSSIANNNINNKIKYTVV